MFLCVNVCSREVCFCAIIFGREKCVFVRYLFERSVFCAIIFGREKCVFVRYLFERSVFLCDNICSREVCFCAIIFVREKCVFVR